LYIFAVFPLSCDLGLVWKPKTSLILAYISTSMFTKLRYRGTVLTWTFLICSTGVWIWCFALWCIFNLMNIHVWNLLHVTVLSRSVFVLICVRNLLCALHEHRVKSSTWSIPSAEGTSLKGMNGIQIKQNNRNIKIKCSDSHKIGARPGLTVKNF